jgi:Fe-S cluster assembly protein SufD
VIRSLSSAFTENPDLIKTYLTRYASYREEPFIALNTAFAREGTFIFVPDNTILEEPIHVINISDPGQVTFQSHPRNLIIIGKNSQVSLVESLNHLSDNVYFQNSVSEVLVRENAIVDHIKIQDESKLSFRIATTQVQQEQSSVYHAFSIDLGGALVRNNLNIGLTGENAEANLFGFYLINGKQHLDNHTNIDHLVPNCNSNELYKGILDGKSRAVFSGTIFVEKNAQKTNAFQSNKNLLLSNEAEIDSKPQLKIFADDVKCSHGATIGQIDDQALFYLRQRGISLEDAHILLRQAFAVDVFEKIRIPAAKEYINDLVTERLKN